jgi:integrase/recombinase XerD
MVQIIRKAVLPSPSDVPERLRAAAACAASIRLREPRPAGFPLLFSSDLEPIEPAIAFLHEHAVQRAHTADTVRTYAEILYDWFDTLEQNRIGWSQADAADLVGYRNRMLTQASAHTTRPYSVRTINHRVRGVVRFYGWAVRSGWLRASPLIGHQNDFTVARRPRTARAASSGYADANLFVLRQFTSLPRPLSTSQARELLAALAPPYDLMARWQLYTGLRVSEVQRLTIADVFKLPRVSTGGQSEFQIVDVLRKGRKSGSVFAPAGLLEETAAYVSVQRCAWLARAARARRIAEWSELFIGSCGRPVTKSHYQRVVQRAGRSCGFKTTTHLLRATFACMMLARLERLAQQGALINPLLIVKVLMGHEHIETTDRYLRAIAVDTCVLNEVLDSLIAGAPA